MLLAETEKFLFFQEDDETIRIQSKLEVTIEEKEEARDIAEFLLAEGYNE